MKQQDAQGYYLGIPYDFRAVSAAKIKSRIWNPGGSMLSPHVGGWGYTLNFAHPGSWALGVLAASVVVAALNLG